MYSMARKVYYTSLPLHTVNGIVPAPRIDIEESAREQNSGPADRKTVYLDHAAVTAVITVVASNHEETVLTLAASACLQP